MAIDGKWNITIKTPMGDQNATISLKEEGGALTGEMSGSQGGGPIENGSVDGDTVKWDAKITTPMPMTLEFEGKQDGENLNGTVKLGSFGNSTFTGVPA